MFKKKTNRILVNYKKILMVSLPIIIIGISLGCYFTFKNQNNDKKPILIVESPNIDESQAVFPIIKSSDFYHLIEFENGKAFIGNKMMAAIIKDIVTRLGTVNGDIKFYIKENSSVEKRIYFKWIYQEKEIKKTYIIYAEMLVQDLIENVFSRIVFTKLETIKKGLIKDFEDFFGGIVEDSDTLFDEDMFNFDKKPKKNQENEDEYIEGDESKMIYDFSFVDELFPKAEPLIKPLDISIDFSKQVQLNKKMISDEYSIKIYQSDLDLSRFVLGDEFDENREKKPKPE